MGSEDSEPLVPDLSRNSAKRSDGEGVPCGKVLEAAGLYAEGRCRASCKWGVSTKEMGGGKAVEAAAAAGGSGVMDFRR